MDSAISNQNLFFLIVFPPIFRCCSLSVSLKLFFNFYPSGIFFVPQLFPVCFCFTVGFLKHVVIM